MPTRAPYGSWASPVSGELAAAAAVRFEGLEVDGADVLWAEARPSEEGRTAVVRLRPGGGVEDVTPQPYSARSRVHEYGGGAFAAAGGVVWFVDFPDQRIYRVDPGATPRPITEPSAMRYGDLHAAGGRLFCVGEDHRTSPPANVLLSLDADGAAPPRVVCSSRDFYAHPRVSPDGRRIAWLCWDHPNMPWDGTELWVGEVSPEGDITDARRVAGGPSESVFQPSWSPDGRLYFVSDRTGWWNLYRLEGSEVVPVCVAEAELGLPLWLLGTTTYAFAGPGRILCAATRDATQALWSIDAQGGEVTDLAVRYTWIQHLRVGRGRAWFVGASPDALPAVVSLDLHSGACEVVRRGSPVELDPGYLSAAEPISFPTEGGETAYGLYYPPRNRDFEGPEGERPPLVVFVHGGPTSMVPNVLNVAVQFFTSRGLAVVDVNYGGSTGYGRAYRERLYGQWGVVDVDDCVAAARFLASRGLVDPSRMVIRGGSAGGYTTLCALAFRDVFRAGASYFGVADLQALISDEHKFESRYTYRLVGPPERREAYRARSPVHHAGRIRAPVIFFQGLEDKVVPPAHSEVMVDALRRNGVPVAYLAFPGEGHGFRRAENIRRALEAELYFYSRVLGFTPADDIEAVPIENL